MAPPSSDPTTRAPNPRLAPDQTLTVRGGPVVSSADGYKLSCQGEIPGQ